MNKHNAPEFRECIFVGTSLELCYENSINVDGNSQEFEARYKGVSLSLHLRRLCDYIFIPRFQGKFQMNV